MLVGEKDFYVGRWLKALKYFGDEHGMPSLKPGDYIQIKEVVDGIGIGYKDGRKHLLFNTKYIDSYLSTNFELMPEDFTPTNNKNKIDMRILEIKEKVPQTTTLPDGSYFGIWGGSVIELDYKGKTYELTTEEGVRGIGYKVVVNIKDGVATFTEIKN